MSGTAPPPYLIEYRGSFTLPAAPDRVWFDLGRFDQYQAWWSWLRDLRVEGGGLVPGCILDGVVVPPLPYRLHLRITLLHCVPPREIRAALAGDLQGQGWLLLRPVKAGTRADVAWTLEMMQQRMRVVSRVARPFLLWGHDRVVEATLAGFSRHLTAPAGAPRWSREPR